MGFPFLDATHLQDGEIFLKVEHREEAVPEKQEVPTYRFGIYRMVDDVRVGRINFRVGHNESMCYRGNVGYEIDAAYRGNRYALKACKLVLRFAKEHAMAYLYITCDVDNVASEKTILGAGLAFLGVVDLPEEYARIWNVAQKRQYKIELKSLI